MNIKVTVKHKLVVNGREYGSPDEMPEDLRHAYERAMGGGHGMAGLTQLKSKVVFQGKEYETPADMPDEARKLYDMAMATANLERSRATEVSQGSDAKPAGLVERDGVFVAASHKNAAVPASARRYSINLSIGRGGLLVLAAVLLIFFWYALSGSSALIR